jgi:hypothetical protein
MIRAQAARDSRLLAELVRQARELAQDVRPIRPRTATAVALTAADGGNNAVAFNPFSLQIVRVVARSSSSTSCRLAPISAS